VLMPADILCITHPHAGCDHCHLHHLWATAKEG
jgi:hypothetical protein